MQDRILAHGELAFDVLRRLVEELLARKTGGHLIEHRLDELDLRLALPLNGSEAAPGEFAAELVARIDRVLDDAIEQAAAFRPGHAFCHRCRGTTCEHTQPPSSRHVLAGYAPTGTPSWIDFAQLCLELRHPEVDRLYLNPPAFLTVLQGREQLRKGLLDAFSAPNHEPLAQVCAGFFAVPAKLEEGRGVVALTFQVTASRARRGRGRLGLNILGRSPSGADLNDLWERQRELPWRRSVRWAQTALQTIRLPAVRKASEEAVPLQAYQRVEAILRGLARRLERDHRSRGRRTRHAEDRHESGKRPTRNAFEDAKTAGVGDVLLDERTGALVVLGDRGRTHFFTEQGKLVSSVRYSREAIERKRKQGLWREASAESVETLRQRVLAPGDADTRASST